MALDSRDKRASAASLLWLVIPPLADGSLSGADCAHLMGFYRYDYPSPELTYGLAAEAQAGTRIICAATAGPRLDAEAAGGTRLLAAMTAE